ncbi:peritrophin-1-like [Gigantopelta aegis]|uniref:peritrophin-1-like n=1 Tax=Gigantopelta aegis TaxID=1735272 RepID=UPI001B88E700|nr:peritrophin-1-like [Gigantopelta aegis]
MEMFVEGDIRHNSVDSIDTGIDRAYFPRFGLSKESRLCGGKLGLFPHPQHCDQYIQCFNGGLWVRKCPVGLQFNPDTRYCDWKYNVNCRSSKYPKPAQPSKCPIVCPNHVTYFQFPDWTNCSSYYICTFGLLTKSACPSGLYYDFFNWRCTYPHQTTCFL